MLYQAKMKVCKVGTTAHLHEGLKVFGRKVGGTN